MMTKITDMKNLKNFRFVAPVDEATVTSAETNLDVRFADDYKQYLLHYGVASCFGHELTGLGSTPRLDVVEKTLTMRELNEAVGNLYVIEDVGLDGIVVWQSSEGAVFQTANGSMPMRCAKSLMDYLKG